MLTQGDKTTCGGKIIMGSAHGEAFGKSLAQEGDPVTCGKDGKIYKIVGGISFITSGDSLKRLAGSLDSYSSCPCKAKFLPSHAYPVYEQEALPKAIQRHHVTAVATPTPSMAKPSANLSQPARTLKANSHFSGISLPTDNTLSDGVYLWTETMGAGHAFVSVHENTHISLYTYGRYGRTGPGNLTGDGILNFLQDEDARSYYRIELYRMGARAFHITDANVVMARKFFEDLWNNGTPAIPTLKMPDTTRRQGHTIDEYDVTGSNCTTHSVEGIKFAGSKVFESGYTSMTTQLPIDAEEDFTVPVSLQRYLVAKSAELSSMLVVEVTDAFKAMYMNKDDLHYLQDSRGGRLQQVAAESAALGDSLSPYSGGTIGGVLGGSYEIDE